MKIENWTETQLERLASQPKHSTTQEKKKIGYDYIKSALHVLPQKIEDDEDLRACQTNLESLIDAIPPKEDGGKISYGTYPSSLSRFKQEIKRKHHLVSKGTYLSQGILGDAHRILTRLVDRQHRFWDCCSGWGRAWPLVLC
jgi:uncharacterized protein YaaR (DUF327 family)